MKTRCTGFHKLPQFNYVHSLSHSFKDPVHTTPFSNENNTVLFRFQKDLHPHLSFSYHFHPSTLQRVSVLKTILNLIFFYKIFFLHYFPCNKLNLFHYAEFHPGLVPNRLGTESFLLSSFRPKLAS